MKTNLKQLQLFLNKKMAHAVIPKTDCPHIDQHFKVESKPESIDGLKFCSFFAFSRNLC
jgi:hypothetical protein